MASRCRGKMCVSFEKLFSLYYFWGIFTQVSYTIKSGGSQSIAAVLPYVLICFVKNLVRPFCNTTFQPFVCCPLIVRKSALMHCHQNEIQLRRVLLCLAKIDILKGLREHIRIIWCK